MLFAMDPIAARQRHEDMLREAAQIRLARQAVNAARTQRGTVSLLSRMVKLLSRSSRPAHRLAQTDGTLNQHQLADAKGR
jgi:hypothetical protein